MSIVSSKDTEVGRSLGCFRVIGDHIEVPLSFFSKTWEVSWLPGLPCKIMQVSGKRFMVQVEFTQLKTKMWVQVAYLKMID